MPKTKGKTSDGGGVFEKNPRKSADTRRKKREKGTCKKLGEFS